ncbi:hypothetical protein AVEN_175714-1 [Araneus ventricosus]|uniref:Uncharacterized protein n=1 Tax=Araneus ventricosus TaxID=182803 RepID=A0A4Y2G6C4_ARAVE|nr:hypothetical protein AVEN_175714-1 [Araneus ventricosus]
MVCVECSELAYTVWNEDCKWNARIVDSVTGAMSGIRELSHSMTLSFSKKSKDNNPTTRTSREVTSALQAEVIRKSGCAPPCRSILVI